jgi:hypothetical protein
MNLNKLEYYQNAYKELRKKYNDLNEEKLKLENTFNSKLDLEKEKLKVIVKENEENGKKINKYSEDIKQLSEVNKNMIIEVRSINNLLDEAHKVREVQLMELNFYKMELTLT